MKFPLSTTLHTRTVCLCKYKSQAPCPPFHYIQPVMQIEQTSHDCTTPGHPGQVNWLVSGKGSHPLYQGLQLNSGVTAPWISYPWYNYTCFYAYGFSYSTNRDVTIPGVRYTRCKLNLFYAYGPSYTVNSILLLSFSFEERKKGPKLNACILEHLNSTK